MIVLDASALLAMLLDEPGTERVRPVLDGAAISSVNLAEIVSHYAKLGAAQSDIQALLEPLPITVIAADEALAYAAGMLRPVTLRFGLSLGDRCCLALAKQFGATAVTAERRWAAAAELIGVELELIR